MRTTESNRWKGYAVGVIGGAAGLLAMRAYTKAATGVNELELSNQTFPIAERVDKPLQSISLVGKKFREGESSSEAVGRTLYRAVRGKEPRSAQTVWALGNLVHFFIGVNVSGLFNILRQPEQRIDWQGGLLKGLGLWLFGDELMMPLFGVAGGPTAYPLKIHVHSFVGHAVYGLVSSLVAQSLRRIW